MNQYQRLLRRAALATVLVALAGCNLTDPYKRPGVWRPMGANESNFELQVARAADLVQGRGTADSEGASAAAAVDRLRADKVKALPTAGTSKVGTGTAVGNGNGNGGS